MSVHTIIIGAVLAGAILLAGPVCAQNNRIQKMYEFNRHVDSLLNVRYNRVDFDTAYVTRPDSRWTISARTNVTGAKIGSKGKRDGQKFYSIMRAPHKSTVSLGVTYRGISVSMSLNPAKLAGRYSDTELSFSSFGRKFGIDVVYQKSNNFSGWLDYADQERIHIPSNILSLKTLNINGYYVFNNRKFSYPAAVNHTFIQKKSAGSFLLAVSGQGQKGVVNDDSGMQFSMTNIGIGGGYGYNYVPSKGWLIHLSATPTIIVYSNTSLSFLGESVPLKYSFPEVIISGRIAIVRQVGNLVFGVTSMSSVTNIGRPARLDVFNHKWTACAYVALRLK